VASITAKKKQASPAKKKSKISNSSGLLLIFNFLAIILLLLSYSSVYISPARFWPLAFMGLLFPLFVVINLFFVLFWMVFLKKYFLFSLCIVVIGWFQIGKLIRLGSGPLETPGEKTYKVLSYNVRLFDLYNWKNLKAKTTRKGIFDLIYQESPDILCLQEYYTGDRVHTKFSDTLQTVHHFRYYYIGLVKSKTGETPFGLATFSKYPIVSEQKVMLSNNGYDFCLITDIVFPRDTVRVLNTHLESVRFGKEDYVFVEDFKTADNAKSTEYIKGASRKIFGKMKAAYIKRVTQVEKLGQIIDQSPYPVILAADFNDTPVSYAYHQIDNRLEDSFVKAGSGIGQTYSGSVPWLRIDYIFTSENIKIKRFTTLRKDYSDHFPIICWISTPGKK
jgi:endonuclease/exonuclease/phosphatase family metal-dependent hydrolase